MMIPRRLIATTFLALGGSALGVARAQADPEAVTQARATLTQARQEKEAAYDALEALILELKDDYDALTTGPRAAAQRQALVLVLVDSVETARGRLGAARAAGRPLLRGHRRRILEQALVEPVLRASPVDARLGAWVARRVADALSRRQDPSEVQAEDVHGLVDGLFDQDLSWYEFWNQSFHADLEQAQRHRLAWEAFEQAGVALERVLHPERYGPRGEAAPPGMVVVPGGVYELGPNTGWERPARKLTLRAFFLDRREVTQGEYALFVNGQPASRRAPLLPRGWRLDATDVVDEARLQRSHPVVFVSWSQAAAYAAWSGKRLPSEDEWEAAAAGMEGRVYPWGDAFQDNMAHGATGAEDLVPVESFPYSRSPAGCFDMAGNVWEWTATAEQGKTLDELPDGLVNMVIRGGSYRSRREELTTRARWTAPGHDTFASSRYTRPIGFRCAKDLP